VLQAASKPIKLPDYEHVAFSERLQAGVEARPVIFFAGCLVGIDLGIIDAGGSKSIALEIERGRSRSACFTNDRLRWFGGDGQCACENYIISHNSIIPS
jgi:hypothetical protein